MMTTKKTIISKVVLLLLIITLLTILNESSAINILKDVNETVYVIQLRKNTNPKVIESAKKPLLTKYPDKTLLTTVQPPNYILSIGYFTTEAEAQEFKKGLEKDYPGCTVAPYEKK
jgi:hypothetical protein